MPTDIIIAEQMLELANTASDLLVGLQCHDTPEVLREARRLKDQAVKYGTGQLAITAHNMELAAASGDLDAAGLLIPELHNCLKSYSSHPPDRR